MANWFDRGANTDDFPDCACGGDASDSTELIVVLSDRTVWTYEHSPEPVRVHEKMMAWGAGAPYALGAMAAGADARAAVEIASQFNVDCGFGVRSFAVKNPKDTP